MSNSLFALPSGRDDINSDITMPLSDDEDIADAELREFEQLEQRILRSSVGSDLLQMPVKASIEGPILHPSREAHKNMPTSREVAHQPRQQPAALPDRESSRRHAEQLLDAKLRELEDEISAQKSLRQEMEREQQARRRASNDHERREAQLLASFDEERKDLQSKLAAEKQEVRRQRSQVQALASAGQARASAEQRAEADALRATITQLKVERTKADKKHKMETDRLRGTIDQHQHKISELEESLRHAEEQRLHSLEEVKAAKRRTASMRHELDDALDRAGHAEGRVEELESELEQVLATREETAAALRAAQAAVRAVSSTPPQRRDDSRQLSHPQHNVPASAAPAPGRSPQRSPQYAEDSFGAPEPSVMDETINQNSQSHKTRDHDHSRHHGSGRPDIVPSPARDHRRETAGSGPGAASERPTGDVVSVRDLPGEKKEFQYADGRIVVLFRNGTRKEKQADGTTVVYFSNGDVRTTSPDKQRVVYYYSEAKTTHTSMPDGTEVYDFPNGQRECHLPSGEKEISFPDGTRKTISLDGRHTSVFPDGMKMVEYPDGRKDVFDAGGRRVEIEE